MHRDHAYFDSEFNKFLGSTEVTNCSAAVQWACFCLFSGGTKDRTLYWVEIRFLFFTSKSQPWCCVHFANCLLCGHLLHCLFIDCPIRYCSDVLRKWTHWLLTCLPFQVRNTKASKAEYPLAVFTQSIIIFYWGKTFSFWKLVSCPDWLLESESHKTQ